MANREEMPVTADKFIQAVRKYGFEYFGLYYGNYRGFIVSHDDPQKMGRVQVRVPQLAADNKINTWAFPKGQPAGADFGDFMIPPKGSPVWVEFEHGDPNHPIYSGGHWGKSAQGVPAASAGNPKKRVRVSEKWIISMDDDGDTCTIKSKTSDQQLQIKGDGTILLEGSKDNTQITGENRIEQVGGDSTEQVGGNKSITCANFSLIATGTSVMNLNGVTITSTPGQLDISIGGSNITINNSGVNIMGRDFISHTHTGVDTGGGTSGGVS